VNEGEVIFLDSWVRIFGMPYRDHSRNTGMIGTIVEGESSGWVALGDAVQKDEEHFLTHPSIDLHKNYIWKLSHHGSKTSTSRKIFETLNISEVWISCGKNNRYGHPHGEVLSKVPHHIGIRRTDEYERQKGDLRAHLK
jgi:competence protein ComEC